VTLFIENMKLKSCSSSQEKSWEVGEPLAKAVHGAPIKDTRSDHLLALYDDLQKSKLGAFVVIRLTAVARKFQRSDSPTRLAIDESR
jgi:hypothetical protein